VTQQTIGIGTNANDGTGDPLRTAFTKVNANFTDLYDNFPLIGTTTNDNAATGQVGEYVTASVALGSAVALTTATPANVTSISLTAGDWDVSCQAAFNPAGTTNITQLIAGISTVSATIQTVASGGGQHQYPSAGTVLPNIITVGNIPTRLSLAATTTVYFVVSGSFTVSTLSAFGIIRARRMR
jgi:hypothetical protein